MAATILAIICGVYFGIGVVLAAVVYWIEERKPNWLLMLALFAFWPGLLLFAASVDDLDD